MAQRKLTKQERIDGRRAYDRMMDSRGEPWKLKLILDREGEEVTLATLARFQKRRELTPEMRRKVAQAARLAVISSTPKAEHTISQAEVAELVALFDGIVSRLKKFEVRGNPDTGGTVEAGPLALDVVDGVEIEMMETHFRDCWVPGGDTRRLAGVLRKAQLKMARTQKTPGVLREKRLRSAREEGKRGGRK